MSYGKLNESWIDWATESVVAVAFAFLVHSVNCEPQKDELTVVIDIISNSNTESTETKPYAKNETFTTFSSFLFCFRLKWFVVAVVVWVYLFLLLTQI